MATIAFKGDCVISHLTWMAARGRISPSQFQLLQLVP